MNRKKKNRMERKLSFFFRINHVILILWTIKYELKIVDIECVECRKKVQTIFVGEISHNFLIWWLTLFLRSVVENEKIMFWKTIFPNNRHISETQILVYWISFFFSLRSFIISPEKLLERRCVSFSFSHSFAPKKCHPKTHNNGD